MTQLKSTVVHDLSSDIGLSVSWFFFSLSWFVPQYSQERLSLNMLRPIQHKLSKISSAVSFNSCTSLHKAFIFSSISVSVIWICAKIAITADEPMGFIAGNRSPGPITITGSVWVPTLTFPRLFCSICNLTRSCSSGVSSLRLQGCIFGSATSEVVSPEPS